MDVHPKLGVSEKQTRGGVQGAWGFLGSDLRIDSCGREGKEAEEEQGWVEEFLKFFQISF